MASRFWVGSGSSTNWNATANTNWAATSGGANNASVPGATDDVIFDANSGTGTANISASITVQSIDCTGFTGTWTQTGGVVLTVAGSLTLAAGMTYAPSGDGQSITITGAGNLTTAGKSLGNITLLPGIGNTVTLQDAITLRATTTIFNYSSGNLNTGGYSVTCGLFTLSAGGAIRTLTLGASTITCQGTGTVWNANATGLTFNANTSTIVVDNTTATAKTFAGAGLTYNNLTISGDNVTISGNNTFNILANNTAGLATGLKITSGTTQIVTNFVGNGIGGSTSKLAAVTGGSAATISCVSGIVQVDYMSIQDITVSGGATFLATNSTNVSGNTDWTFLTPCYFKNQSKFWGI